MLIERGGHRVYGLHDGSISHGRSHQASKIEAGRAHSESQETKNRTAGDTSSFHEGKKKSRALQTMETTCKFNLLNMRRLCPCRMSKHFRQGA